MNIENITSAAIGLGATAASHINISSLMFYPELLELCEMNSCGKYATNWRCPPACGSPQEISGRLLEYTDGVVFQYIGQLEDSFDYENMSLSGKIFSGLAQKLLENLEVYGEDFMLLGKGGCSICKACTYPSAPCRYPHLHITPLEACGINVSELCALAGLNYINGPNTVTYSGLAAFNRK